MCFPVKLTKFQTFKNTYFYRTTPMAASENIVLKSLIALLIENYLTLNKSRFYFVCHIGLKLVSNEFLFPLIWFSWVHFVFSFVWLALYSQFYLLICFCAYINFYFISIYNYRYTGIRQQKLWLLSYLF